MEKRFDHKIEEPKILEKWKKSKAFEAKIDKDKEPYTIVLPPPNASGKMHTGNVLMIAIEDLLIRWKRMQGYSALWLPGTDHAGFETQTTFEKELEEQGKSRFDYDRDTLYEKIMEFVQKNREEIHNQIDNMGASIDWSRYTFTLDEHVIDTVYNTFLKMEKEKLVYRDDFIVNFCPECGTTFADLEVKHKEQRSSLYYLKYGPLTVATTRPETTFGDVAVAVNPEDERYKKYIGKEIEVELLHEKRKMLVIGDRYVDPEFGTGALKITPAHDKNDYEIGLRHNLPVISVIGLDGKLNENTGPYAGMGVKEARKKTVEDFEKKGLLEKVDDNYMNAISVCYKAGHEIEPTILPNWFVKVESLKKPALEAVQKGDIKIYPKWQEITYTRWMEEMRDWPISRQVVWGIRIPAWYNVEKNPDLIVNTIIKDEIISGRISDLLKNNSFKEIEAGLQSLISPKNAEYTISKEKPKGDFLQETDTFDTWFSSGHWPLVTLRYPDSEDFKYFYPTSVLETGWEIVRFWVSRMIMFGIYLTGKVPFKDVYLHGLVRALDGKKMSKSLGNIINPEEYLEEYGVDALRMGLISGTANGKDFAFPRDKVIAFRNFGNKLWNMARFLLMMSDSPVVAVADLQQLPHTQRLQDEDKKIIENLNNLIKNVNKNLEKYRFTDAAEAIYQFMWHEVADVYLESIKNREDKDVALGVFMHVYKTGLKLLHPFMPFVTEAIWNELPKDSDEPDLLASASWPTPQDI